MTTTFASPKLPTVGLSRRDHRSHRNVKSVALATLGLGVAIIIGFVGTPAWCVTRLVVLGAIVSGLFVLARREASLARASLLAFAGFVGTVIGTTIAYPYLTTTGVTLRALAGVLAATGGSALLLLAGANAVTRLRGWRKLFAIPVAVVVAYAVGVPIAIAVYATNVPRPKLGAATPSDRGLQYEDARFRTSDGVQLSGWYLPSHNRAGIVLLHGASSTRSAVLDEAVVLARHGYGVLLFDARGMGRSGGRAMDFGWYGDEDVGAAVDYLAHRSDVDPGRIGAVGESMGGEEAIGAMAHDIRIRTVVAEGATNRVSGDWKWLSDTYGIRGSVQRGVHWFTYQLTDMLTAAHPPITLRAAVAKAAPRRVLLVAAGGVADEANADRDIQRASPTSVDVWVVPNASHTGGLRAAPDEWTARVIAFLGSTLTRP